MLAPLDYSSSFQAVECTQPLNEQVYDLQCEIIRKLAAKGSCVMVGRCADYVLKDQAECLNVFIYFAPLNFVGDTPKRFLNT